MEIERQWVVKIPANQGPVCLFVPIMVYMKGKIDDFYHKDCLRVIFACQYHFWNQDRSKPDSWWVIGTASFSAANVASWDSGINKLTSNKYWRLGGLIEILCCMDKPITKLEELGQGYIKHSSWHKIITSSAPTDWLHIFIVSDEIFISGSLIAAHQLHLIGCEVLSQINMSNVCHIFKCPYNKKCVYSCRLKGFLGLGSNTFILTSYLESAGLFTPGVILSSILSSHCRHIRRLGMEHDTIVVIYTWNTTFEKSEGWLRLKLPITGIKMMHSVTELRVKNPFLHYMYVT